MSTSWEDRFCATLAALPVGCTEFIDRKKSLPLYLVHQFTREAVFLCVCCKTLTLLLLVIIFSDLLGTNPQAHQLL